MALPLLPLAGGALIGGAGVGAGSLLGGAGKTGKTDQTREDRLISKKDVNVDARQTTQTDARQLSYNPQIQVESPGATQTSKKEMSSRARAQPTQRTPTNFPTNQETGGQGIDQSGVNLEKIGMMALIVGGGAYVAGEFVK